MRKFAEYLFIYSIGLFSSLVVAELIVGLCGVHPRDLYFKDVVLGVLAWIGALSLAASILMFIRIARGERTISPTPAAPVTPEITETDAARKDSLQSFDDFNRHLTKHRQHVADIDVAHGRSFVEEYGQGKLSLVLYTPAPWDWDEPGWRLRSSPTRAALDCSVLILKFNVANAEVVDHWNENPVLVLNVETVYGPQGFIPSLVGFYVASDAVEECGVNDVYLSLHKRVFKILQRRENRESSLKGDGGRDKPLERRKPSMVDGALKIMDSVPNQETDLLKFGMDLNVMRELLMTVRINLGSNHVELWQRGNSLLSFQDVLIGPLNLEERGCSQTQHSANPSRVG